VTYSDTWGGGGALSPPPPPILILRGGLKPGRAVTPPRAFCHPPLDPCVVGGGDAREGGGDIF